MAYLATTYIDGQLIRQGKIVSARLPVNRLIVAGWTGRDAASVEHHIAELEKIGVRRPPATPVFYNNSVNLVTTSERIQVIGEDSSGEVEFVLARWDGELWVGAGSDHTDRKAETYDVTMSKQLCSKPIASQFWLLDEVSAHWDELQLQSYILESGKRLRYQSGSVKGIRPPSELVARFANGGELENGTIMLCGTLAAIGGVRPADNFEFELVDPVLKRTISHKYQIESLPAFRV